MLRPLACLNQVFGAVPGEQLRKAYTCYLSTTSGPVIGTLYLSTARLAFCSDSPFPYHGPAAQPPEPMCYKASKTSALSVHFRFSSLDCNQFNFSLLHCKFSHV
jgi:hypothetical protein